jgi:hypothetical protein
VGKVKNDLVHFDIVEHRHINQLFLHNTLLMAAQSSRRLTKSPGKPRTRNAMSQKRLQAMIESGQKMDVKLGNSDVQKLDRTDLRPEKERAALLLWVCSNR